MIVLNYVGLVLMVIVLAAGTGLKIYTRRKLKEIDGMGGIHCREETVNKIVV